MIEELQPDEVTIELDDVEKGDLSLCLNIEKNVNSYVNMFCQVVDELYPAATTMPTEESSPLEVLIHQRRVRNEELGQNANDLVYPPDLVRKYTLVFKARSVAKNLSVREVGSSRLGGLVKITGMVTRVSNVKPLCVVAAYACDQCGNEVFQETKGNNWTPLDQCPSLQCKTNSVKGKLFLQTRGSKFSKFEEVKIQELTSQVPMGHIPRSMTVHVLDGQTRKMNPGQVVSISGAYLPLPYTGFKARIAGLLTDTILKAHSIVQHNEQYHDMEITKEITDSINDIVGKPRLYDRLASSIAPEIFGHTDVKKALLLMLVGGSNKETADGMKVRGDINICMMGDPGVAKSQLLKHISKVAPRAVYTTGRGSSGVGLTASVTRDPVTNEMVLEGGALVLADNGIACIDEFDKMGDSDRTAIHEVMEQQTISISKAGITTTLNARTAILAAANPQYGRYNPNVKPTDNINLPAALLSRFDLLFLLLDTPSPELDLQLGRHVTFVHKNEEHPKNENQEVVSEDVLKHYIAIARTYEPLLLPSVADYLVNVYVHMRSRTDETSEFQYTSARSLLSVIRLASALVNLFNYRLASDFLLKFN